MLERLGIAAVVEVRRMPFPRGMSAALAVTQMAEAPGFLAGPERQARVRASGFSPE